ncbi:MAG TPA: VLRF1 family aeRF1-type release factor [Solirubrobacterales bacterium]|nr:VLRF1 family aeRF1-type release factor [Solirubrobacterales bacterium]
MSFPSFEDVRELLGWRPSLGVVSVYLEIDPADRGGAWHTELRNGLAELLEGDGELDHQTRVALRASAKRVADRFDDPDRANLPRGKAGFVEVAADRGASERWWPTQIAPRSPAVAYLTREPVLAPLVDLAGRCVPRGVAILSAERVRLLERGPGRLRELRDWELTLISDDWRERKAPMVSNPAAGRAVSAAGHDQYDERLEANRHRFLGECGRLVAEAAAERGWSQVLAFGAPPDLGRFRDAIPSSGSLSVDAGAEADLISEPRETLREQVEEAVARVDGERDRALVERALEESRAGGRGAAGRQETSAALVEGRVDHLLLDAALALFGDGVRPALDAASDAGTAGSEPLVRSALAGGARVTAVAGDVAAPLQPFDGVAALLRY